MKIAFISDIHGNAQALDAVLRDIEERNVDRVCVLGDLCFRGPEPGRSLDLVKALNTDVIRGNADEWALRGIREGEVPEKTLEMMKEERAWTYRHLDQEHLEYLESLPLELKIEHGKWKIHAFHATPVSLFEILQPSVADEEFLEKIIAHSESDLYVYGHIHKPFIRYVNGKCIINTGSVGLPFDGLNKPSYALVEIGENHVETVIVRVDYDVGRVIQQFHERDYPNAGFMENVLRHAAVSF